MTSHRFASALFAVVFSLIATSCQDPTTFGIAARPQERLEESPSEAARGVLSTTAAMEQRNQEQGEWCATTEPTAAAAEESERELREVMEGFKLQAAPNVVEIPVYWWVISSDGRRGDVRSGIQRQMIMLNEAFAATPFRFRLAGTQLIVNANWYHIYLDAQERAAKQALKQGGKDVLNIYTGYTPPDPETGRIVSGWSYLAQRASAVGVLDGVVVRYTRVPSDTAIHEVGHWLNLHHTFYRKCHRDNDFCADTPAEESPARGCPTGRDSCPRMTGRDPIDNFMDYTFDRCRVRFTRDQNARMVAAWLRYRAR